VSVTHNKIVRRAARVSLTTELFAEFAGCKSLATDWFAALCAYPVNTE
jgi:hypothetical protein